MEKAEHASRLAERRYQSVDAENRLVARQLERDWEAALTSAEEAHRGEERRKAALPPPLTEEEKRRLRKSLNDLPRALALKHDHVAGPKGDRSSPHLLRHRHPARGGTSADVRGSMVDRPRHPGIRETPSDGATPVVHRRRCGGDHSEASTRSHRRADRRRPEQAGQAHRSRIPVGGGHVQGVRGSQEMGKPADPPADHISIREAMARLRADNRTVRRLIAVGKLLVKQAYPHARWHISRASVDELARKRIPTNE